VVLRRPPPNQLNVSDLWRLDLVNTTNTTFFAYAHGWATEARDGLIVDATSARFRIPPGRTTLTGDQLQPVTVNESHPDYEDDIIRTGSVRSGEYRVCVEVFTVESDSLLGTDCYDQIVEKYFPPILISPIENTVVSERPVVFTWTPPTPVKSGIRVLYKMDVAEVLGRQSPTDAINSNALFFTQKELVRTVLPYPIVGARQFDSTQTYAWRITAYERGRTGREYVIGTSETELFRVGSPSSDVITPHIGELPPIKRGGVTPSGLTPVTNRGELGEKNTTLLDVDALKIGRLPPDRRLIDVDKLAVKPKIPPAVLQELLRHCNE
jgi:hypothetical protein